MPPGAHDAVFASLGRTLVAGGQGDAWLRLGWEFNGDGYSWAGKDPAAFAAYYRRAVGVLRAVPGAHFRFVWNPQLSMRAYPAEQAWPGADVVDSIGLDLYDTDGVAGTYPLPAGATPAVVAARREAAWQDLEHGVDGLDHWAAFAAAQHVALSMPEWGLVGEAQSGGGDDAAFVAHVAAWTAAHGTVFESYFDAARGSLGDQRVGATGGSPYPAASAAYRRLFGG